MSIRYRRGRPEDVKRGWRSIALERGLFTNRTFASLPDVLADLIERERVHLCAFEERHSARVIRLGGFALLDSAFLRGALTHQHLSILEQALICETNHRPALLNRRQVAAANYAGALDMLCFFGTPDMDEPLCADSISLIFEAWRFFVKGYQLRSVWQEHSSPRASAALETMGFRRVREVPAGRGPSAVLMCVTRSDALESPGSILGSVLVSPQPKFQLTGPEQIVLEHALLDLSDREIAHQLHVSPDAIKKRWRSIYTKVAAKEPCLFRDGVGGVDRRRVLMRRLRHSLEELRPYPRCGTTMVRSNVTHAEARVE